MPEQKTYKPDVNNPVVRSGAKIPFFPVGDRVVVQRIGEDEEMINGVVIPRKDMETNNFCTVIAAGPVAMDVLRDMCVEIGDTVAIGKYSGVAWEWRTPGTLSHERVDVINVKDVFGCAQLVDKIMSGDVAVGLDVERDGVKRFRFYEAEGKAEHTYPEIGKDGKAAA